MARDFLGNELSIGDDVVFLNYNGTSASLERGKITRVSEHTAEISGKRRAEYKIIKVNPMKPAMDNTWIPVSERLPDLIPCKAGDCLQREGHRLDCRAEGHGMRLGWERLVRSVWLLGGVGQGCHPLDAAARAAGGGRIK